MWGRAGGWENEARNNAWNPRKVCGVPELCEGQPFTTGVRWEEHPATSALWNPKWRVPFLLRSQTPIGKTGSLLPLHEHMSLIKHAAQRFAWHDLSANQKCCKPVICKSRKTLKSPQKAQVASFPGISLRPSSFSSSNSNFCHDPTTTAKLTVIFCVVLLLTIQF